MNAEVAAGRAAAKTRPDGSMTTWEYADGTVVRYKPKGDEQRDGPTYSVELKMDASVPDSSIDGIAFKIGPDGVPVPRDPRQVRPYYPKGSEQADIWVRHLMDLGHRTLRRK